MTVWASFTIKNLRTVNILDLNNKILSVALHETLNLLMFLKTQRFSFRLKYSWV